MTKLYMYIYITCLYIGKTTTTSLELYKKSNTRSYMKSSSSSSSSESSSESSSSSSHHLNLHLQTSISYLPWLAYSTMYLFFLCHHHHYHHHQSHHLPLHLHYPAIKLIYLPTNFYP